MKNRMVRFILNKLNSEDSVFTYSEYKDFAEKSSSFGGRGEIAELISNRIICQVAEEVFRIIVDIASFRKYVLLCNNKPQSVNISSGLRFYDIENSTWHVKSFLDIPDIIEDESEEDEDSVAAMRRRDLINRIRREACDDADDDDENIDMFSEDCNDESEECEDNLRNSLIDILTDTSENGRLLADILKIIASEEYLSVLAISSRLNIAFTVAENACLWLYLHDFIEKDDEILEYKLAIPEELFRACCIEAKERKTSIESFATILKKILQQKLEAEVWDKFFDILSDLNLTRSNAIIKIEGCLYAARDIGNDIHVVIYQNILTRLNGMSDYVFNHLKNRE